MTRNGLLRACVLATVLMVTAAVAQQAGVRIRGDVDALDGHTLHVTSRSGEKMAVTLTPDATVTAIVPITLGDIKPGSYIGTAALPQPDGTLRALEVHVFPDALRGTGEGSRPFDLAAHSTMTNGTVGNVVGTVGRTLTVTYQGRKAVVNVPPDTPIVTYERGSVSMLTPGAHILIFGATRAADGTLNASRVSVGKNGLVPPM
jgi:hypothetical protein